MLVDLSEIACIEGEKLMRRPNLRKMFIADPGFVMVECDLAGADAQVVAWTAGEPKLMEAFRSKNTNKNFNIHLHNAELLWGEKILKSDERYKKVKTGGHLTNYGGGPSTLMKAMKISKEQAEWFQGTWFTLYPFIKMWHQRVGQQLKKDGTVVTRWGRKMTWHDRAASVFTEALAAEPQSTVGDTINKGLLNVRAEQLPSLQILLQVHDSLLMQFEDKGKEENLEMCKRLNRLMEIAIPFPDPLTIPLSWKLGYNWGEMEEVSLG